MPNLEVLYINDNQLTDDSLENFSLNLEETNIRILYMGQNNFSSKGIQNFFNEIQVFNL